MPQYKIQKFKKILSPLIIALNYEAVTALISIFQISNVRIWRKRPPSFLVMNLLICFQNQILALFEFRQIYTSVVHVR